MTAKQALKISNQNNIYYTSLSKAERLTAAEVLAQVRMSAREGYKGHPFTEWSDNDIFNRINENVVDYLKSLGYEVDTTTDYDRKVVRWSKPTK